MLWFKKIYKSLSGRIFILNITSYIPLFALLTGTGILLLKLVSQHSTTRFYLWLALYILTVVITLLMVLYNAFFVHRNVVKPIKKIRDTALELAEGKSNVRIHRMKKSPEEFIELAETFNYMVNHIEERNTKLMKVYSSLSEQEAMFRLISHNVPGIVYLISAKDNSVQFINDRIEEHTGYEPELFLKGEKTIFDLIIEEDRQRVIDEVSESIQAGVRFKTRFQIELRSGEHRFYESFGTCFRTLKKEQVIEGFATDITEKISHEMKLQHSLSEQQMLLKEVHHRVKNNLAMISSLIHLQQDASSSDETAKELEDLDRRIISIALIHEKLYQSNDLSIVDFTAYIEALTTQLQATLSSSEKQLVITTHCEGITLPVDRCIPLGLLINELITNAWKHSADRGPVRVEITFDYREGEFSLILRDSGRGLPDHFRPEKSQSLGFQLIQALSGQLSGKLSWFNDGGAVFSLTFPEWEEPF